MTGTLQMAGLQEVFLGGRKTTGQLRIFTGPGATIVCDDGSALAIEQDVRIVLVRLAEPSRGEDTPEYGARIGVCNAGARGYHTIHVVRPCALA